MIDSLGICVGIGLNKNKLSRIKILSIAALSAIFYSCFEFSRDEELKVWYLLVTKNKIILFVALDSKNLKKKKKKQW